MVFFNVIHANIPPAFFDGALDALQRVSDLLTAAGGKRYVADWLGDMDEPAWQRHFGPMYDSWVQAKTTFDPQHTFCSLLLP